MPLNSQVQPELVFSPDNSVMVSVSGGTARAWNTTNWELITKVSIPMRHKAMRRDSAGLGDRSVPLDKVALRVEDAADPARYVLLVERGFSSDKAALSLDGRLIVTWSSKMPPRLWRLPQPLPKAAAGRKRRHELEPQARLGWDGATCVLFSDDGRLIFTGMANGTVQVWDADTGAAHSTPALKGPGSPVTAIATCWDGSAIATVSDDGLVRVWDTGAGKVVVTQAALPSDGQAAWFPDGSYRVHDSTRSLWWAIGLCRFERGELDPYGPAPRLRSGA
jgi:WD40 repeat protein